MDLSNREFYVKSSAIATSSPAVYCLISKHVKCLYIGQTNSKLGVLGRFSQHLSSTESNTFKQRILSLYKLEYIEVNDVFGCYYSLPRDSKFSSAATDFRDAVEANVQLKLIGVAARAGYTVISRVSKNPQCSLPDVQMLARDATKKFEEMIRGIVLNLSD